MARVATLFRQHRIHRRTGAFVSDWHPVSLQKDSHFSLAVLVHDSTLHGPCFPLEVQSATAPPPVLTKSTIRSWLCKTNNHQGVSHRSLRVTWHSCFSAVVPSTSSSARHQSTRTSVKYFMSECDKQLLPPGAPSPLNPTTQRGAQSHRPSINDPKSDLWVLCGTLYLWWRLSSSLAKPHHQRDRAVQHQEKCI